MCLFTATISCMLQLIPFNSQSLKHNLVSELMYLHPKVSSIQTYSTLTLPIFSQGALTRTTTLPLALPVLSLSKAFGTLSNSNVESKTGRSFPSWTHVASC